MTDQTSNNQKLPSDAELDQALARLTREAAGLQSLQGEAFDDEAAAALYAVASLDHVEAMPADLERRLAAEAVRVLQQPAVAPAAPRPAPRWWENLGLAWGAAAVASTIAMVLAVRSVEPVPPTPSAPTSVAVAPKPEPEPVVAGEHYAWQPGPDKVGAQVKGEVVWDEARGTGYLKVSGLPVNDPNSEQYQLWIFDATRDDRYPVDGGVFDVRSAEGVASVAIRAPVRVRKAALFAVTLEKAGGVVVSDRGRIVAMAKAESAPH